MFSTTTNDLPYSAVNYIPGATAEEQVAQFSGVEIDFFRKALEEFDQPVDMTMLDTWYLTMREARDAQK